MPKNSKKELSINETRFIGGILGGLNATEVYRKVYKATCKTDNAARSGAYRLLNKVPHVMAELERRRKELAKKADYDFDKCHKELGEAIEFATATNNATARVRAIELRAKLSGILVERQDTRNVSSFNLHINGIDDELAPPPIEGVPVEGAEEMNIFG